MTNSFFNLKNSIPVLFILANILTAIPIFAQPVSNIVGDIVMPAPEAGSLGKYGDIPVNYNTGVPSVSIPVHTLNEGPLSLSVNLSYHASGVRVAETASWVGTGWSLSAGGMISRSVVSLPDDKENTGYYYVGGTLTDTGNNREQIGLGLLDGEPDVFSFNFGNYSGKFVFDNGQPKLIPQQDLVIDEVRFGTDPNIKHRIIAFTILDPMGNKYHFGNAPGETSNKGLEMTDFKTQVHGPPTTGYVSSWYLVKISSHDELHAINLNYDSAYSYSYLNKGGCDYVLNFCNAIGDGDFLPASSSGSSGSCSGFADPDFPLKNFSKTAIRSRRLTSITTRTERLDFNANTLRDDLDPYHGVVLKEAKRLDQIELTTPGYCVNWDFDYEYFRDPAKPNRSDHKKLKLTSLQKKSCNGAAEENPYVFSYYTSNVNPDGSQKLINRLSREIDHWGFYNGASQNEQNPDFPNIPPTTFGVVNSVTRGSSNRETNASKVKDGVLSKIEYPTGGTTFYEFEANTVLDYQITTTNLISNLENCYTPGDNACCINPVNSEIENLSASEIAAGQCKLFLAGICGSGNCEGFATILIEAIHVNSGTLVGNESFTLNPCSQVSDFRTFPLTDLEENANFIAGQNYEFKLTVSDGKGQFNLWTENANTPYNRPVGGLRVKEIRNSITNVKTSDDIIKTYDYSSQSNPGYSSGVLYQEPIYAIGQQGWVPSTSGQANIYIVRFSDNTIFPLGTFHGYHVAYERVIENHNGNGRKIMKFKPVIAAASNGEFPVVPSLLDVEDGKMIDERIQKSENGSFVEISSMVNTEKTVNYTNTASLAIKIGQFPAPCSEGDVSFYKKTYRPRTTWYQVASTVQQTDNVSTTTSYTYDASDRFSFPKIATTTNSDGSVTEIHHFYNHDYSGSIGQTLRDRNIIAEPYETQVRVDGVWVSGSKREYTLNLVHPRLWKFYNYEKTWDVNSNLTGSGWALDGTINSYDPLGFPSGFTKEGWDPETYIWTTSGQIKERNFLNFKWKYDYYPNTRLLKTITDIDGQKQEFEYDDLLRLEKTKARNNNVITDYIYHFKNPASSTDRNWVNTKTTYTPVGASSLTKHESRQYLDGLGRPTQSIKIGYTPSGGDVVQAVEYDKQGRVVKQYVPFASTSSNGGYSLIIPNTKYTQSDYESSPLNRMLSETPPGWFATTTSYGANAASEVSNLSAGGYYAANALSKMTVTDPNGNEDVTYTDKKGRVVLSKRKKGSLFADTYTLYDDKDRVSTIVPPDATLSTSELIYKYRYDQSDNVIWKKIPGKAAEETLYNTKDLPAFYRDGKMLAAGQWKTTKYDNYGREQYSGMINFSGTPNPNSSYGIAQYHSYNFYVGSGNGKGKIQTAYTINLDNNNWLPTSYTYDNYGRVDYTRSAHHLYTSTSADRIDYQYDFADNVLQNKLTHKKSSTSTPLIVDETYDFDHSGRLENSYHKIGSGPKIKVSNNVYNSRDFLTQKNLHGTSGGGYLQNIDYSYNAQGWLKKINDLVCMNNGGGSKSGYAIGAQGLNIRFGLNPDRFNEDATELDFNIGFDLQVTMESGEEVRHDISKIIRISGFDKDEPEMDIRDDDGDIRFEGNFEFDFSKEKITPENISDFLLSAEEKMLAELADRGVKVHADILTTQLQRLIEQVIPFSAEKFLEEQRRGTASQDLFAMSLTYEVANNTLTAPSQKNGNISSMTWQVGCTDPHVYGFNYDFMDRITQAKSANIDKNTTAYKNYNRYNMQYITYDKRGNINRIFRRGVSSDLSSKDPIAFNWIDFMYYGYAASTNKLNSITEHTFKNKGFKSVTSNGVGSYGYDVNGNVTSDQHKGISNITYNYLNLPRKITYTNGNWIEWDYTADGRKLRKTTSAGTVKDYISGVEYKNNTLEAIYHKEGRCTPKTGGYQYKYALKDHLGNMRVTFTDSNGDGMVTDAEILEESHYYPFGMLIEGTWSLSSQNKYRYNNKELNDEFGLDWYDYGARYYEPAIGRFTGVDPIADKFAWVSTYNYAENEPAGSIDLWGLQRVPQTEAELYGQWNAEFERGVDELEYKAKKALSESNPSYSNMNRKEKVLNGVGNLFFGVLGTIGAAGQSRLSGGATGAALVFTLSEAAIGTAQILDGLFGEASDENPVHESSSIPGLIANANDSEYADLIDAFGQFLPGMLSGGNIIGGFQDAASAAKAAGNGEYVKAAKNAASATDAYNDTNGVYEEAKTIIENNQ